MTRVSGQLLARNRYFFLLGQFLRKNDQSANVKDKYASAKEKYPSLLPQPTPPKKPPRRNLSVSPTHLQTQMSLSADSSVGPSNYEYLFLARSGARSHIDLEQLQKRRDQLRHVTRSVDQYVEMKSRLVGTDEKRESNVEPVAITSIYENRPVKMLNPRRKLRRHAYESYEPESGPCADKSPCSDGDAVIQEQTFVSNAFLTLKSSQESLLDEKREMIDEQPALENREATDKRLKRVQMLLPTSPTHYVQPPTPDHPPPSAMQAERSIHERIRPLSQVSASSPICDRHSASAGERVGECTTQKLIALS